MRSRNHEISPIQGRPSDRPCPHVLAFALLSAHLLLVPLPSLARVRLLVARIGVCPMTQKCSPENPINTTSLIAQIYKGFSGAGGKCRPFSQALRENKKNNRCPGRDLNPCRRLERPMSLTGLDDQGPAIAFKIVSHCIGLLITKRQ